MSTVGGTGIDNHPQEIVTLASVLTALGRRSWEADHNWPAIEAEKERVATEEGGPEAWEKVLLSQKLHR